MILRNIQNLVEAGYVDGRPKHHLPSARELTFTPKSSIFFIADHSYFMKLSKKDIHRVARDRHIVVQNVPQEEFLWNRETLSKLGSLEQLREIQGKSRSSTGGVYVLMSDM